MQSSFWLPPLTSDCIRCIHNQKDAYFLSIHHFPTEICPTNVVSTVSGKGRDTFSINVLLTGDQALPTALCASLNKNIMSDLSHADLAHILATFIQCLLSKPSSQSRFTFLELCFRNRSLATLYLRIKPLWSRRFSQNQFHVPHTSRLATDQLGL